MKDVLSEAVKTSREEGFASAGASSGTVSVMENPERDRLMQIADERMYADKREHKSGE